MKELIFAWLLSLPWTAADKATETAEVRTERMRNVAQAVTDVSRGDRQKAAFVLVQFSTETDFDAAVQRCECKRYQCDPRKLRDGSIEFRAHGLAQVHDAPAYSTAWWWSMCGASVEATVTSARFALTRYNPVNLERSYARLKGIMVSERETWAIARAARARALARKL
jgi:hypothetical protein